MGETPKPQQIEITLAPGAGEALARVIVEVVEQYASARIANVIEHHGPAVEPWTFCSPHSRCDVTAYLDDHNQVRHVPVTRTTDVPAHWRRLFIERAGD